MIFHKKDENPSKETSEELGWRERRSQQIEDVEITDVNDNDDKVWDAIVKKCLFLMKIIKKYSSGNNNIT